MTQARRCPMARLGPRLDDVRRGLLTIEQSEWKGKVTETKGMEYRVVPMTTRLKEALKRSRRTAI